jgi:hypothetical protein
MVWHVTFETLQGNQGVCAKEVESPRLLPNEQKSSIDGINCGCTEDVERWRWYE